MKSKDHIWFIDALNRQLVRQLCGRSEGWTDHPKDFITNRNDIFNKSKNKCKLCEKISEKY